MKIRFSFHHWWKVGDYFPWMFVFFYVAIYGTPLPGFEICIALLNFEIRCAVINRRRTP